MTTQIQRPTVGHMHHFLQEREDWRKVLITLRACQHSKVMGIPKTLDNSITLAAVNASKQFPNYQMFQFPTSFQATDSVMIWREAGKLLLGRKHGKKLWRLPGGFVDPKDENLEQASQRERKEECGVGFDDDDPCLCSHPTYIGSCRVPDPRYANSPDKIMSAMFLSYYIQGTPKAGDDLATVKWFTKEYVRRNYSKMVEPVHHPLMALLINRGYL